MTRTPSNIKERILLIAKNKGISYEPFFHDLGMTYGNFKGEAKNRPINSDFIISILLKYTDINPEWLLTGVGNMLKNKLHDGVTPDDQPGKSYNNDQEGMIHEGSPNYQRKPSYDSLEEENKRLKEDYEELLMKYKLLENDFEHSNTQIELLKNINEEKERTIAYLSKPNS